ncbi:hypothetical protein JCM18920_3439 [Cutibacterium acnes JCM 18920]|nr:hypothetical protein JCM18920_3439 [Cutibacterium acnes JCM 18920]
MRPSAQLRINVNTATVRHGRHSSKGRTAKPLADMTPPMSGADPTMCKWPAAGTFPDQVDPAGTVPSIAVFSP